MEPEDVSGDNLTGGYLIEIDAYAEQEVSYFKSNRGTPVTIKSPDDEDIVAQQSAYIKNFFDSMESAVFASNFTDEAKGYRKYLDLDSFLRFFIVGEFAGNTDTYWSVYMYKDRNSGKLYTGPIWDYDLAFENDNRTYPINNIGDFIYASKGSVASWGVRDLVNRIVKEDTAARDRLIELWDGMRSSNLTEESLLEYVGQTAAMLEESQQLNFKRWKILSEQVHQNYQALGSYSAEVYVIKNYIRQRLTTLDGLIHNK